MIESTIKEYQFEKNPHQKVQVVTADSFDELNFLEPEFDPESFDKLKDLYVDYIIKKYKIIFGKIILFYLPDDIDFDFEDEDKEYGHIYDELTRCAIAFRKHIHLKDGKLDFDDERIHSLYDKLVKRNCLVFAQGDRNNLTILPVGKRFGFLSKSKTDAKLKVNANFFVMDMFDCGSIYDQISTPLGLCVKKGNIISPPLFDREVLVYKNKKTSIERISLKDITVTIDNKDYHHNDNAVFYSRPKHKKTPMGGFDIIIVKDRIVACKKDGDSYIPSCGFILHLENEIKINDLDVKYSGLEDIDFAIQVGNSTIIDNKITDHFISPFYNFLNPFDRVSYPPSMYPLKFKKDRAPRIVLGSTQDDKPMILWLEGAAKFGHNPLTDSCGVSLSETTYICADLKMKNGIHLDGGGSAQIILNNKKYLMISDRKKEGFEENERAVPMGLYIK